MRLAASLVLFVIAAAACVTLWRSPWTYAAQDRSQIFSNSMPGHPAGTDELGRDRSVRTAMALLLDSAGAGAASTLASALSVGLGIVAAFAAPWVGWVLLYLADLFLTLPWIFLLMMVRSALPLTMAPLRSAMVTFLLLGLLGGPAFLRVHFARLSRLRRAEWRLQGRAMGLKPWQEVRQLLPHLRPMLLVQFLLYLPACIMAEANLGTLGLGVAEPLSSCVSLLQCLQNSFFLGSSSLVYLPIFFLVIVLMALELLISDREGTVQ